MIAAMRSAVPLVVLAAIAMAPVLFLGMRSGLAPDPAHVRAQLELGWGLAATAWVFQLWLVAGAAALARGETATASFRALLRAIVPWAIAVVAIGLGLVALVVPGCLLLVLLAQTGASTRLGEPPPAPLVDSIASVRRRLRPVAWIVAVLIACDLAVAGVTYFVLVHGVPAKLAPAATRTFVHVVALGLAALAPVPAWLLARVYTPKA
jgi:hypothetical protein